MSGTTRPHRTLLAAAVAAGVLSAASALGQEPAGPVVRPLDRGARTLLEEARHLSPTVESEIATLVGRHVIVYLSSMPVSQCRTGRLSLVGVVGATRYLLIEIPLAQGTLDRCMWLGHELQHAIEIGSSDVSDAASLERFYRRTGRLLPRLEETFETDAAMDIGRRVRVEVSRALQR